MIQKGSFEAKLGRAMGTYVSLVRRHAALVLLAYVAVTIPCAWYAATHLTVNADASGIFSDDVPQRKLMDRMRKNFPALKDTMIVVVDGPSQSAVREAAEQITEDFRSRKDLYSHVFAPVSEPFFRQNGLLYLSADELDEFADQLARVQPYLGELTRDASLRGFFELLQLSLEQEGEGLDPDDLDAMFGKVAETLGANLNGESVPFAWDETIAGKDFTKLDRRQVVMLKPVLTPNSTKPAAGPIDFIRERAQALSDEGVSIRLTGELVLMHDDVRAIDRSVGSIVILSLSLVSVVLFFALRRWRLNAAVLCCLIVAVVHTAGFAALAVGTLNLISSTFPILIIGLSVDFGLHFSMTYQRRIDAGLSHAAALRLTGEMVGTSLLLCAFTTSVSFLAFQVTDFIAIAELGLICGAGMAVSFIASMSMIPAVLTLWPGDLPKSAGKPLPAALEWACGFPARHRRAIIASAIVLGLAAATTLPYVTFNSNPIEVRDPTTESAQLFTELLEEQPGALFSMQYVARDHAAAEAVIDELEALEVVANAYTIYDMVPDDQDEKLEIIDDINLFMPSREELRGKVDPPIRADTLASLRELEDVLAVRESSGTSLGGGEVDLLPQIRATLAGLEGQGGDALLAQLEKNLVGSLTSSIDQLYDLFEARQVSFDDLPEVVRERFIGLDGSLRVMIQPEGHLATDRARRRFAHDVGEVVADATGMIPETLETGTMVGNALREALSAALAVMVILLLLLWRRFDDMLRVLVPLLLGALCTSAAMVIFGMNFNFANVIVIPLMLGIGIDTGIHLVHRARFDKAHGPALLRTETTRAVIYSSLTSLASFGSLGVSTHLGMASIGRVLFLAISFILVMNLVLLPALLEVEGDEEGGGAGGRL